MWPDATLKQMFDDIAHHNMRKEFDHALVIADALVKMLEREDEHLLYAYTLGCRKAVALRHLDRIEEAEAAFNEAYELALSCNLVIAAYIRNDWASLYTGDEAAKMVREALDLLDRAEEMNAPQEEGLPSEERDSPDQKADALPGGSPDPERAIKADRAYFNATLACILHRQGKRKEARRLLAEARQTLEEYAYGSHPRYKDSYLLVLGWEFRNNLHEVRHTIRQLRQQGHTLGRELLRQRGLGAAVRFVRDGYLRK